MAILFHTIGHSTRTIADLTALLRSAAVEVVIDVRAIPRSRTNPQFNRDSLPNGLAPYGVGYTHMAELGGLRGKARAPSASPNTFWENESFRNYADYATTAPFRAGLARLRALGAERPCAIMCAEAVWWRCHRRIVADYLLDAGEAVFHILGPGQVEMAKLTPAARRGEGGALVYRSDG